MKATVFAFGKLRTPGLRESADYYRRNLGAWLALEEVELKPLPVQDKSAASRRLIQEKEGELLLQKISARLSARALIFLLDETGINRSTSAWAEQVRSWEKEGSTELAFCVGSSLGFSDAVRKKSRGSFSLGAQTLSHELARVVLLEQLYRAWSVTRGHPYHNEGS